MSVVVRIDLEDRQTTIKHHVQSVAKRQMSFLEEWTPDPLHALSENAAAPADAAFQLPQLKFAMGVYEGFSLPRVWLNIILQLSRTSASGRTGHSMLLISAGSA